MAFEVPLEKHTMLKPEKNWMEGYFTTLLFHSTANGQGRCTSRVMTCCNMSLRGIIVSSVSCR